VKSWLASPVPVSEDVPAKTAALPLVGAGMVGMVPGARSAAVSDPFLTLLPSTASAASLGPVTAPFLMLLETTRFLPITLAFASAAPPNVAPRMRSATRRAAYGGASCAWSCPQRSAPHPLE
jgi:hypothetical protein